MNNTKRTLTEGINEELEEIKDTKKTKPISKITKCFVVVFINFIE
jgi:hypothetical protein